MRLILAGLLAAFAAILSSQPAPREQVGPHPEGGFLLNSGWRLRPAGKQVPVDTLPMSMAVSPDGKFLAVLNGGYRPPSISVIDVASDTEVSRTPVADAWLGITFSPRGDFLYVGGGSQASVFEFAFANGKLSPSRTFVVVPEAARAREDFVGDVALSPDGRLLYAATLYRDTIAVINPQSGMVIEQFKTGRRPYRIYFHPTGKSLFVTSWADGSVSHHEAENGRLLSRVRTGPHSTDMVWLSGRPESSDMAETAAPYMARLFVAAANSNSVFVLGVSEGNEVQVIEVINVSMSAREPAGMTPSALALSPDGKRLFVACSDANTVAVVDISEAHSRVLGFVPTGWYPTAVRALADGRIVVLNGRGVRSHPNLRGPNPLKRAAPAHVGLARAEEVEYIPRIQTGTASFIDPFDVEQLDAYTQVVLKNSPYTDRKLDDAGVPENNPIPTRPGAATPIKHVIYIIKENRTYDQMLGDMKEGNGDPSLVLFGEDVSPNHHKLAREFVLLDNFYVNADVSADGHAWSTAAIASDYIQKMWPNSYARRRKYNDYYGTEPASTPPAGFIWSNAAAAGVSMRNYGHYVANRAEPGPDGVQIEAVRDPSLQKVTNMKFRTFDMKYPDVERAKVFLEDLAGFEKAGQMPQFILMRLSSDHTSGTAAGAIAPKSAVADNDYALGMVVEAISKSSFWPATAIFVIEDDAQNGADHVDSHRSPAYVISPYVKRGSVDSTMYNTTSMLRTMELILGLQPMTHFDAGARPMWAMFQPTPNLKPYEALPPTIPLDERNPAVSPTSARSARLDFSAEDLIDDNELNEILWLALRGPHEKPPRPVRSYFSR